MASVGHSSSIVFRAYLDELIDFIGVANDWLIKGIQG